MTSQNWSKKLSGASGRLKHLFQDCWAILGPDPLPLPAGYIRHVGVGSFRMGMRWPTLKITILSWTPFFQPWWLAGSMFIYQMVYGSFLNMGVPRMDGLNGKILLRWMIWGYPHFRKPPYVLWQQLQMQQIGQKSIAKLRSCWALWSFARIFTFKTCE